MPTDPGVTQKQHESRATQVVRADRHSNCLLGSQETATPFRSSFPTHLLAFGEGSAALFLPLGAEEKHVPRSFPGELVAFASAVD